MATVTLTFKNGSAKLYAQIENFAATGSQVPYWMIQTEDERVFHHFDNVVEVVVEGENELVEKAKEAMEKDFQDKSQARAQDLGLEA